MPKSTGARARETPGLFHRQHRVVGEHIEILCVGAAGRARAALVIDECADALRGEHALKCVEVARGVMLRAMDQHHHRNLAAALGHHQAPDQLGAAALERRLADNERDALPGFPAEGDLARGAIGERYGFTVGLVGPAKGAAP
jgi:hypothetical protein